MNLPEQKLINDSKVVELINQNNHSAAAEYLLHSQLNNWEFLKINYDRLKKVQTNSFLFNGFKINVQLNPERIKSTAADVDEKSVLNRRCFLCVESLPREQKGILLGDKFLLLCNPFPVLSQHFTISSINHEPQSVIENFQELILLTKLLSPGFTILYNGPACGASAPDHLHFQAVKKYLLPIEMDIQRMKNNLGYIINTNDGVSISLINDQLRRLIVIESKQQSNVNHTFKRIFDIYKSLSVRVTEPMMNIISSYNEEIGWRIIIYFRSKHRPECFYIEEPKKILVSPAAIDLSGLLITPREEDYIKISKKVVQSIFNEVSLEKEIFSLLNKKLSELFN